MKKDAFDIDPLKPIADGGHYQSGWDQAERPSVAVVEAIATLTGHDPTKLPPLYKHIDPDALDTILTVRTAESENSIRVSFVHEGVEVTVDSHRGIKARRITEDDH